jgi:hypothetical protein
LIPSVTWQPERLLDVEGYLSLTSLHSTPQKFRAIPCVSVEKTMLGGADPSNFGCQVALLPNLQPVHHRPATTAATSEDKSTLWRLGIRELQPMVRMWPVSAGLLRGVLSSSLWGPGTPAVPPCARPLTAATSLWTSPPFPDRRASLGGGTCVPYVVCFAGVFRSDVRATPW